eukprot:2662475-Rhodomonas_salina.1
MKQTPRSRELNGEKRIHVVKCAEYRDVCRVSADGWVNQGLAHDLRKKKCVQCNVNRWAEEDRCSNRMGGAHLQGLGADSDRSRVFEGDVNDVKDSRRLHELDANHPARQLNPWDTLGARIRLQPHIRGNIEWSWLLIKCVCQVDYSFLSAAEGLQSRAQGRIISVCTLADHKWPPQEHARNLVFGLCDFVESQGCSIPIYNCIGCSWAVR